MASDLFQEARELAASVPQGRERRIFDALTAAKAQGAEEKRVEVLAEAQSIKENCPDWLGSHGGLTAMSLKSLQPPPPSPSPLAVELATKVSGWLPRAWIMHREEIAVLSTKIGAYLREKGVMLDGRAENSRREATDSVGRVPEPPSDAAAFAGPTLDEAILAQPSPQPVDWVEAFEKEWYNAYSGASFSNSFKRLLKKHAPKLPSAAELAEAVLGALGFDSTKPAPGLVRRIQHVLDGGK